MIADGRATRLIFFVKKIAALKQVRTQQREEI